MHSPPDRFWAALAIAASLTAAPAAAELVVLVDGRVLKVKEYRVDGDRASLTLPSNGVLTLPLRRIERVVDDEIVPESEIRPFATAGAVLFFRDSDTIPDTPYGELIFETARRHEVGPALVAAMVRAESAFDPEAVSVKGARGLLQLMPATARRFGVGVDQLFNPERNLDAGVRYVKWLTERFDGELPLVLAGYNAGEANVDRYAGVPPFRETRNYIARVYATLGLGSEGAVSAVSGSPR
jgi:hypothetical protein